MHWIIYVSLSAIVLGYISSLKAFRLDMPMVQRYFSLFLLFVFLGELFGIAWPRTLYSLAGYPQSNQWFYNVFHFLSYLFYLWLFYRVLETDKLKKTIRTFAAVYILFALSNMIAVQGILILNTYTDLLACFIMVFLSLAYYYRLLHAPEIITLHRDFFFWVSTGLLIYHLGSMMGLFLINVMNAISNESARNIHLIIQLSAALMYINYSIAFLCLKKK
jgi:hypothetical protein